MAPTGEGRRVVEVDIDSDPSPEREERERRQALRSRSRDPPWTAPAPAAASTEVPPEEGADYNDDEPPQNDDQPTDYDSLFQPKELELGYRQGVIVDKSSIHHPTHTEEWIKEHVYTLHESRFPRDENGEFIEPVPKVYCPICCNVENIDFVGKPCQGENCRRTPMRVLPGVSMSHGNFGSGHDGTHTSYAWWHGNYYIEKAYEGEDLRVLLDEHDRKIQTLKYEMLIPNCPLNRQKSLDKNQCCKTTIFSTNQ